MTGRKTIWLYLRVTIQAQKTRTINRFNNYTCGEILTLAATIINTLVNQQAFESIDKKNKKTYNFYEWNFDSSPIFVWGPSDTWLE